VVLNLQPQEMPDMVHELFPYLHVTDGAAAIRFYEEAFGARELFRLTEPPTRACSHPFRGSPKWV
jgi:uncharacterized glyoxalase superfamily protein PhnB